jgi:hypothetical protein
MLSTVQDLLNIIDKKTFNQIRCHNEKNGMFNATTQGIEIDNENKIIEFYCALVTGTKADSEMISETIKNYPNYELRILGTNNKRYPIASYKNIRGFFDKEDLFLYVYEN